jgi:metal-responsive CopG/Arc/MetJ family transcriptional regulator
MDTPKNVDGEGEMVKLNLKIPERLLKEIDELADELNYTNRSEFIREVLRDTTESVLTPGSQEGVSQGYADVAAGRTTSHEKKKFGIDG